MNIIENVKPPEKTDPVADQAASKLSAEGNPKPGMTEHKWEPSWQTIEASRGIIYFGVLFGLAEALL
jgi:hypothetical protein